MLATQPHTSCCILSYNTRNGALISIHTHQSNLSMNVIRAIEQLIIIIARFIAFNLCYRMRHQGIFIQASDLEKLSTTLNSLA